MDPGKCLLLKGRVPKTVSHEDIVSVLMSFSYQWGSIRYARDASVRVSLSPTVSCG